MVLIEYTRFHWKLLIFGPIMGQSGPQNINCYSIYGHTFFGHNLAIFCPIGLKIILVSQKIIIYRLVMRNHDFGAKGSGASSSDQKVCLLGGPFGSSAISKTCFQKNRVWTPEIEKNVSFYSIGNYLTS